MYSFDDLFLFAQVVEIGSYVHTAKKLKLNETTVGRRIKNLEQSLNVKLINMTTKHFEVTDFGKQIYSVIKNRAVNMEHLVEVIDDILKSKLYPKGTITVVLPNVLALELITPKIPYFLEKHPQISLNILYQNKEIDLIKDGIDVAILNHIPKRQSQIIKHIFSSEVKLFCTKKYANKYGVPNKPQDLSLHRVIGYINDDYSIDKYYPLANTQTGEVIIIPMPKIITTNSTIHNIQLLQTNKVIGPLLCDLELENITKLNKLELINILPEYHISKKDYYLLRHPTANNDLKIQLLCNFLEQCLKK
mgnify:CR=1 FL=1|jgi:DNA-binding transcriptional LysR family regulator